nr:M24 family metallopeptidase [Paenibacillus periandrae]
MIRNLCSHGIGKVLHVAPTENLPVYNKHYKRVLQEGMVLTIKTFLSTVARFVIAQPDRWALSVPRREIDLYHYPDATWTRKTKRSISPSI